MIKKNDASFKFFDINISIFFNFLTIKTKNPAVELLRLLIYKLTVT